MIRRYLEDNDLDNHDRGTTAGLAVACLRAGDEDSALEVFRSAVKPSPAMEGTVGADEDEGEEDWAMNEAEERIVEILEAEGEVLPELLGYYLDRLQKDRSQEAAFGVSKAWGYLRLIGAMFFVICWCIVLGPRLVCTK